MDPLASRNVLRERVQACRACVGMCPNLILAPRFGAGQYDRPPLMIVGQNPPADLTRAMHGGWLVHYPNVEKGPHELLIEKLLQLLGLEPKQVYVTQAVKCPTKDNARPDWQMSGNCVSRFLQYEVRDVQPQVIIAFGVEAGQKFNATGTELGGGIHLLKMEQGKFYHRLLWNVKGDKRTEHAVSWVEGDVIRAPHVSMVGRFVGEGDWLTSITEAYELASISTRPIWTEPPPVYLHRPPEVP